MKDFAKFIVLVLALVLIVPGTMDAAKRRSGKRTTKQLEMYVLGQFGDDGCMISSFKLKGGKGFYEVDGVKRTLKLRSNDWQRHHCVIDAYLRGKYIGSFEGDYDYAGGWQWVSNFSGYFHSTNGTSTRFMFYYSP